MSRDIGDVPDEHGGRRGYQADDSDSRWGGWSLADTITIGLLLVMLAAVTAVLVAVTFGGGYCVSGEEVTTQTV